MKAKGLFVLKTDSLIPLKSGMVMKNFLVHLKKFVRWLSRKFRCFMSVLQLVAKVQIFRNLNKKRQIYYLCINLEKKGDIPFSFDK